ncbi:MAG: hypothetical protein E7B59_03180 [Enterobacteriaceae bacterium]|nr:hypothetical protein [Enterobacteriaceae bacterium]
MSNEYDVFWNFYAAEDNEIGAPSVSSDDPMRMTLDVVCDELLPQLHFADDDFLGITDASGTTLQVCVTTDEDAFWIEIPSVEAQGSYGKECDRGELVELFRHVQEKINISDYPDFQFRPWKD